MDRAAKMPDARDVIAQAVYRPPAATGTLTPAMQSIIDEESAAWMKRALRDADRIIDRLNAAGYSICLVGRPGAPKVRDVL